MSKPDGFGSRPKQIHSKGCVIYAPVDFLLLATEGEHCPDSRQHFLCHGTGLGIRTLLLTSEGRQHLVK